MDTYKLKMKLKKDIITFHDQKKSIFSGFSVHRDFGNKNKMKQKKYEIEYVGFDRKKVLLPERLDTLKECEVVLKKLRKEELIQIAVIFLVRQSGKFRVYKFKSGVY